MLDPGEHRLHINGSLLAIFNSLFRIKPFPGLLFVFSQAMVNFGDTVALSLVANAAQRAAMAVQGLVAADELHVAGSGYPLPVTDVTHRLPHRAD